MAREFFPSQQMSEFDDEVESHDASPELLNHAADRRRRPAGCKQIVLCSPPKANGSIDPFVLATAAMIGIDEVYKVGGAQAIAAMAYGTETIPKVD